MKKEEFVNVDPFGNGMDYVAFEKYCCDKCIKSSEPQDDGKHYTNATEDNMPLCPIQRDIVTRMFCDESIKRETVDICREFTRHGILCPYMKKR